MKSRLLPSSAIFPAFLRSWSPNASGTTLRPLDFVELRNKVHLLMLQYIYICWISKNKGKLFEGLAKVLDFLHQSSGTSKQSKHIPQCCIMWRSRLGSGWSVNSSKGFITTCFHGRMVPISYSLIKEVTSSFPGFWTSKDLVAHVCEQTQPVRDWQRHLWNMLMKLSF